jgi:hypothetical protein
MEAGGHRSRRNVTFGFSTPVGGADNGGNMSERPPADLENVRRLIVETLPSPAATAPGGVIFGPGGTLDSLALVSFLADLEYRIAEVFGREVVLASEQAMSRSRSPFRDVTALSEYVVELLAP